MIRVEGLKKQYAATPVLEDVSFCLAPGDSMVVLGPSGCGKTTLLRLIAGLERPDRGEIHINGRLVSDAGRVVPPHARSVGFVFQEPALWPHFTVAGNILFGLKGASRQAARQTLARILAAMELTGLEDRYPDEISGGQARRVAIARAIAPGPACLLMDEPLVNLDEELRTRICRLILRITQARKMTLIYVTHDRSEAGWVSDRLLRLQDGLLNEYSQASNSGL